MATTPSDYWISPTALYIEPNSLGDPNYVQVSCLSNAHILVYVRGIIDYDAGHNYRRYPLIASPTVFNTNTEKYIYASIPRPTATDGTPSTSTSAQIVFPSELIDIYGKNEAGEQIGSTERYYIFLQGILTSSGDNGTIPRAWKLGHEIATGTLSSDQAIAAGPQESPWYEYSAVNQTVTFLKDIIISAGKMFRQLFAHNVTIVANGTDPGTLTFGSKSVTGVATDDGTPSTSADMIATPAYVDQAALSKAHDDKTDYALEVARLRSNGDVDVFGNFVANQDATIRGTLRTPAVQSPDFVPTDAYSGGRGFGITNTDGTSTAIFDNLLVRHKATFSELEIRKLSAVGGDIVLSAAASRIESITPLPNGNLRIFLNTDDGTTATQNTWDTSDLVRCQTFNVEKTDGTYGNKNIFAIVEAVHNPSTAQRVSTARRVAQQPSSESAPASTAAYIDIRLILTDLSNGDLAVSDNIVQMGNTDPAKTSRQNIIVLSTSGNEPSSTYYQGVTSFDLNAYKVAHLAPSGTVFNSNYFRLTNSFNQPAQQIVLDRGEYTSRAYAYYDRVSYQGSLWLCINPNGNTDPEGHYIAPSATATDYWLQQVAKGATGSAGGALNAYLTPSSVAVPSTNGTPDSGFFIDITPQVFNGTTNVSSDYEIANIESANICMSVARPDGSIRFYNFTAGGTAIVYLNRRGGTSTDIVLAKVNFSIINGGTDVYSLTTDTDTYTYPLLPDQERPTRIFISALLLRGDQPATTTAQWAVESTEGCTDVTQATIINNRRRFIVGALTADRASVTIRATVGTLTLYHTFTFTCVRNGADGTSPYALSLSRQTAFLTPFYNTLPDAQRIRITPLLYRGTTPIALTPANISVAPSPRYTTTVEADGTILLSALTDRTQGDTIPITVNYDGFTATQYFTYNIVSVEIGTTPEGEAYLYSMYVSPDGTPRRAYIGTLIAKDGEAIVQLQGDQIKLEGFISANQNTQINEHGDLYAKNATFEQCVLDGYLRSKTQANWQTDQRPSQTDTIIVQDTLNIMTRNTCTTNVYLPNDPEYIGARLTLVCPTGIIDTTGQIAPTTANYLTHIFAAHTYVKHTYKRRPDLPDLALIDGQTNMYLDQLQDTNLNAVMSPFGLNAPGLNYNNWFIGTTVPDASASGTSHCATEITLQNGIVELLGVPAPANTQMYITDHIYQLTPDGQLALDPDGLPIPIGPDPLANQPATLTQWTLLHTQATYLEYL